MDDPGPAYPLLSLLSVFKEVDPSQVPQLLVLAFTLLLCLTLSATCSAAENAFFSHKESDQEDLRSNRDAISAIISKLLANPKNLLATVLIVNNLANVAFVLQSAILLDTLLQDTIHPWLRFSVEVILDTCIILIFGEVVPKVYATQHYRKVARFLAYPLNAFQWILWPITQGLVKTTHLIERRIIAKPPTLTPDELSRAIDITTNPLDAADEQKILKGIVNFGQTQVKQIMKPRMDVAWVDIEMGFTKVLHTIKEMGFSRMPVTEGSLDQIKGVLYSKDLLPHINNGDDFKWQNVIREAFFVPENKKIDDLLHEFREKRVHLALVVDEFGGVNGLVTLEDVLEEVFGEMDDEFDEESRQYSILDDNTFIFEGKIPLIDFLRITSLESNYFENLEIDSDTLGGLITEYLGKIPQKGEKIAIKGCTFIVEAADMRKIKRIKIEIQRQNEISEGN